jgi:hypothetical protein
MGVFSVGFDNKIGHGFGFKVMCSAKASHTKFFKRKKEKKESLSWKWKVSKKQVFRIKYYPKGGDFIRNPQGLNFLFCKPGT